MSVGTSMVRERVIVRKSANRNFSVMVRALGLESDAFKLGVRPVSNLINTPDETAYYRLGDGGFSRRVGYAITRILVTRQDSGRKAFNISQMLGGFSSAALAGRSEVDRCPWRVVRLHRFWPY
jgi:hypothetical protein